jgi:hypothetical protein
VIAMHQPDSSKRPADSTFQFQPCEIVCLEHHEVRLYAEVVQMAQGKDVCWVRPLAMRQDLDRSQDDWEFSGSSRLYDLRQNSDLLLPAALFRSALDTEAIPLISELPELWEERHEEIERSQTQLRELIKSICLAYPELF